VNAGFEILCVGRGDADGLILHPFLGDHQAPGVLRPSGLPLYRRTQPRKGLVAQFAGVL
jgi:hypothetical protein